MFKKAAFLCIISLFFINCGETDYTHSIRNNPFSMEKEWLSYEVGQTWTYRRLFIVEDTSGELDVPDTLYGYSEFEITKDTVFENATWLIIEGTDYECSKNKIDEYESRHAMTFTDTSLKVYQFKFDSIGIPWGPFKRRSVDQNIVKEDFNSIRRISSKVLSKKSNSMNYDSSVFSDLFFPVVFGVDSGYTWYIRQENDPNGNNPIEKVYMGKEMVEVPAGRYDSHKFELLSGELFGLTDLQVFFWYSSKSLVKQRLYHGKVNVDDDSVGLIRCWDIFEYLGTGHIDKDTLVPWGQDEN